MVLYFVYRPETAVNFRNGLNSVTWDEAAMNDLQRFANESEQFAYCGNLQVHVITILLLIFIF